jgi:hypothetical protein
MKPGTPPRPAPTAPTVSDHPGRSIREKTIHRILQMDTVDIVIVVHAGQDELERRKEAALRFGER